MVVVVVDCILGAAGVDDVVVVVVCTLGTTGVDDVVVVVCTSDYYIVVADKVEADSIVVVDSFLDSFHILLHMGCLLHMDYFLGIDYLLDTDYHLM